MAFVLVPAYAILGPYLSDHPALALRWMGTLLVIGVMVVVVLSIFKELMSDRVMTKVALVSRLVSGFFKRQSALLPTALGLALLGGGGYGLLVLSNYEGADWLLYAAVAGGGLYVLKRTFSVADEIDLLHGPLPCARMGLPLGFPRIHDLGSEVGKVFEVSGCQRRPSGDYNTRDLSVAHVDGSAIFLPFGCEARCGFGC